MLRSVRFGALALESNKHFQGFETHSGKAVGLQYA